MFFARDKLSRNVLVSCDHGLMIVNRFDSDQHQNGQSQWLLDHGNVSTVETDLCLGSLADRHDPVIFDVGANIGTWITLMAQFKPQAQFYAFEPQSQVFQMLCGNLAINNIHNILAYPYAIGSENTVVTVPQPDYAKNFDFGTFSLVEKKIDTINQSLTLEVRTLDTVMQLYKISRLDLIKIDVEGMDIDVLRGGHTTISRYRPVIFIEHHDNRRSVKDDIVAVLDQYDYQYEEHGNNLLCRTRS